MTKSDGRHGPGHKFKMDTSGFGLSKVVAVKAKAVPGQRSGGGRSWKLPPWIQPVHKSPLFSLKSLFVVIPRVPSWPPNGEIVGV
jgi:hypothetical protein